MTEGGERPTGPGTGAQQVTVVVGRVGAGHDPDGRTR
jgi:hypothetical protein